MKVNQVGILENLVKVAWKFVFEGRDFSLSFPRFPGSFFHQKIRFSMAFRSTVRLKVSHFNLFILGDSSEKCANYAIALCSVLCDSRLHEPSWSSINLLLLIDEALYLRWIYFSLHASIEVKGERENCITGRIWKWTCDGLEPTHESSSDDTWWKESKRNELNWPSS